MNWFVLKAESIAWRTTAKTSFEIKSQVSAMESSAKSPPGDTHGPLIYGYDIFDRWVEARDVEHDAEKVFDLTRFSQQISHRKNKDEIAFFRN